MPFKIALPKTAIDTDSFIVLRDVHKVYSAEQGKVHALRGANMQAAKGEFIAIVGSSGCGKSTLLNLLGGIDAPSSGTLLVNGWNLGEFTETQLTEYRRHGVGIIFQFFNLLPLLSVLENVLLPTQLAGNNRSESRKSAIELLEIVGLTNKINEPASHLSGGQMQRVAVVRAMVNNPLLLLADEPTGNLDTASANDVLKVLSELSAARQTTVLMVTHSEAAAEVANHVLRMNDGIFVD